MFFKPLWVTDFPLLEWSEEENKFNAMHHPFTSPLPEDIPLLTTSPKTVRAVAYDIVVNGWEVGGGSIRIHSSELQLLMFQHLGLTPEKATEQFGFLLKAFQYGAPPHGGIAFGLDRICTVLGGQDSIREFIAFPKNNQGRDVMIGAPSPIDKKQMEELCLTSVVSKIEITLPKIESSSGSTTSTPESTKSKTSKPAKTAKTTKTTKTAKTSTTTESTTETTTTATTATTATTETTETTETTTTTTTTKGSKENSFKNTTTTTTTGGEKE